MDTAIEDLELAAAAGLCVDVTMQDGQHHMTGVHAVDEEAGTFTLYRRQTFGDEASRIELRLEDIESLSVTDTPWSRSS